MAVTSERDEAPRRRRRRWYARRPPRMSPRGSASTRRSGSRAARGRGPARARTGPNALPAEKPTPGWRRFLGQYRSYMQIILVAAAIVSLAIKEWSTGVLLIAASPCSTRSSGCGRRARPRAR